MTIELFDAYGQLRTQFSEEELTTVPPEKMDALADLLEDGKNVRDAEAALETANRLAKDAIAAVDAAKTEMAKEHPPLTTHQNWLRDVKRIRG